MIPRTLLRSALGESPSVRKLLIGVGTQARCGCPFGASRVPHLAGLAVNCAVFRGFSAGLGGSGRASLRFRQFSCEERLTAAAVGSIFPPRL